MASREEQTNLFTRPGHRNGASNRSIKIYKRYRKDASAVLFQGDARRLLARIPDRRIKLVISSPPYNIGKAYETRKAIDVYLQEQRDVLAELTRVLREDGSLCWQTGNYIKDGEIYPLDIYFYPLFKSLGLRLRGRMIWHFGHGLHASRRFSGRYETLMWFTKSKNYTFNLDSVRVPSKYPGKRAYKGPKKGEPSGNRAGKNPSDVWEVVASDWESQLWNIPNVKAKHPEKTIHPAQFPIELVERCVLALTNVGDAVLDPYAGAGSSLVAALMHGRKAVGSEAETLYVELTRDRILRFSRGELKLRPLGRPLYVPKVHEKVAQVPREWLDDSSQLTLDAL